MGRWDFPAIPAPSTLEEEHPQLRPVTQSAPAPVTGVTAGREMMQNFPLTSFIFCIEMSVRMSNLENDRDERDDDSHEDRGISKYQKNQIKSAICFLTPWIWICEEALCWSVENDRAMFEFKHPVHLQSHAEKGHFSLLKDNSPLGVEEFCPLQPLVMSTSRNSSDQLKNSTKGEKLFPFFGLRKPEAKSGKSGQQRWQ